MLVLGCCCSPCLAADPAYLSLQPEPESVYAPPAPPREDQGVNEGAVHFDLTFRYMSDYMFRGLDRSNGQGMILKPDGGPNDQFVDPSVTSRGDFGHENAPNLQVDTKLSFDTGKWPHPYVGAFVNVFDSDPLSRFQEVRPYVGLEWTLKPFVFEGGNQTFIYPERDDLNTSEVYGKITFDDSFLFKTDHPILSPYFFGAYDYDLYNGWYFEMGVKHDFLIEEWGLTLTPSADIAYVMNHAEFRRTIDTGGITQFASKNDTGFQHYDIGLTASYSINKLLNFSTRYGSFNLEGYVFYTDGIDKDLEVETQVWGGVGIAFKY
jgi:hypothetical protein